MGRGKALNEDEKIKIFQLKNIEKNQVQIAKQLRKSRCLSQNFLKYPPEYGKKNSKGRPSALSPEKKRLILRKASNSELTSR